MAKSTGPEPVMVWPGTFEERVVYGIKPHVPNRFGEDAEEIDKTGWIHYQGKHVPVESGHWGGALIWQLADEVHHARAATCDYCGAQLETDGEQLSCPNPRCPR